ncbi:MAG: hypothetical protein ACTSR8_18280 [Promethearchaeota archaeon]
MVSFEEKFQELKKTQDIEEINNFLIELGENPECKYLKYIEYFIKNFNTQKRAKINLNIIWLLGKITINDKINHFFIDYLYEVYYNTDRWVRNEILHTLNQLFPQIKYSEDLKSIIKFSINDEYKPIRLNILKLLSNLEEISIDFHLVILKMLNTADSDELEQLTTIIKKLVHNEKDFFNFLSEKENYKILTKNGIRNILISFFSSILSLETFRNKITQSKWDSIQKENFLKEIDIYQKIILKKL